MNKGIRTFAVGGLVQSFCTSFCAQLQSELRRSTTVCDRSTILTVSCFILLQVSDELSDISGGSVCVFGNVYKT